MLPEAYNPLMLLNYWASPVLLTHLNKLEEIGGNYFTREI